MKNKGTALGKIGDGSESATSGTQDLALRNTSPKGNVVKND